MREEVGMLIGMDVGLLRRVEEIVRRAPPALLVLVPVLGVLVVEGDDVVFLGEGPPPLEALPGGETEL